ncbi:MAG: ABC transporter permease [Planctomycetota bacterium]
MRFPVDSNANPLPRTPGPGGYCIPPLRRRHVLHELRRFRGVFLSLTLREIAVRYRQALLGFAWALLQPVALMLVTTLVFHGFLDVDSGGAPYSLFVLTGLVPWTFFHATVTSAVPSLVSNADLVRKIYFPREAIPLASVGAGLLDLGAGLLLWLVLLLAYGLPLGVLMAWVPLLLVLLIVATAAPALLGAAVNVYFRDVKHALPLLLQALFFATPIIYRADAVPAPWRGLLLLNPLTAVIEGLRAVALSGRAPPADTLLVGFAVAVVALVCAYWIFRRASRRFADVV